MSEEVVRMATEVRPAAPAPIAVGQRASYTRTIRDTDVLIYAEISGDDNPLHVDPEFAKATRFGRQIAHGMLVAGLISAVLGCQLPGPGSIYLSQTLRFTAPVYFGDEITATAEVTSVQADKPIVTLRTTCVNQRGETVVEGEAVLLVPWLQAQGS